MNIVGRLSYLKKLNDTSYTKLILVKDIQKGEYYVEKSLHIPNDFQETLFENEMKKHSRFRHRNIIPFVKQTDAFTFLMEYAAKGNLDNFIAPRIEPKVRIKLSLQFLSGLAYLHQSGYAHNDIKPTNILITREERAKLADFAFAGPIGEVTFQNPPPFFRLGTDFFRNPEMGRSGHRNLAANDIYAVGVVLYLLFSGGETRHTIEPDRVSLPGIPLLIKDCLKGKIKDLSPIIDCLKEIKGKHATGNQ